MFRMKRTRKLERSLKVFSVVCSELPDADHHFVSGWGSHHHRSNHLHVPLLQV